MAPDMTLQAENYKRFEKINYRRYVCFQSKKPFQNLQSVLQWKKVVLNAVFISIVIVVSFELALAVLEGARN